MPLLYDVNHLAEVLDDRRVARAFALALRDAAIRRRFRQLRKAGHTVQEAVEELSAGVFLSEEHVRTIVYRKGRLRE